MVVGVRSSSCRSSSAESGPRSQQVERAVRHRDCDEAALRARRPARVPEDVPELKARVRRRGRDGERGVERARATRVEVALRAVRVGARVPAAAAGADALVVRDSEEAAVRTLSAGGCTRLRGRNGREGRRRGAARGVLVEATAESEARVFIWGSAGGATAVTLSCSGDHPSPSKH